VYSRRCFGILSVLDQSLTQLPEIDMLKFIATIVTVSGAVITVPIRAWSIEQATRIMKDMVRTGESLTVELAL
jgi:hypothetical protein